MANQTLDYGRIDSVPTRSSAMDIDPSVVQLFISGISEVITYMYFDVVLLTVLVYHAFTTMDKEVKFFWSKPYSPISLIYFGNCYVGLLSAICSIISQSMYWVAGLCNLTTFVLIDYILQIRLLALYQKDRKLSICLKTLIAIEAGIGLSMLIRDGLFQDPTPFRLAQGINICLALNPPSLLPIISWTIALIYGMILLCLALFKAAEYWRLSSGFKGLHLVRVLIEDQVLYYSFILFCCIVRIVEIEVRDMNTFAESLVNAVGSPTLLCVLGSHLLVNLKEAGERGANEGTSYRSSTVSNIEFAEDTPPEAAYSKEEGTGTV